MAGPTHEAQDAFKPEQWRFLAARQKVQLRTESPIHKGEYITEVIEATEDRVKIGVPMQNGRLILIPVGTAARLAIDTASGPVVFWSKVVDREGGARRCLVVARPRAEFPVRPGQPPAGKPRVIAVTSGKGGVGKSTLVVNLALAFARQKQRVCLIDADLGTANVDVLLNLTPRYNLSHVVRGDRNIFEVVMEGPEGLVILPGGSGMQELTQLSVREFRRLVTQFRQLERYCDVILIDTGSGLGRGVTSFIAAADEAILVTTPEPHAITDAYALLKVAAPDTAGVQLHLVVNMVNGAREARDVGRKMIFAANRFLRLDLRLLGYLPLDDHVRRAVREQTDFVLRFPRSPASIALLNMTQTLQRQRGSAGGPQDTQAAGLLDRVRRLLARS